MRAPNAGRVVLVRNLYYSGNTVIVDHGLGVFSSFAHLSEMTVAEGESVTAGVVIGAVGATGRVTGPHLHWAVRVSNARSIRWRFWPCSASHPRRNNRAFRAQTEL